MNFIDKYIQYASPQTGAPKVYHRFMAYAILAHLINKRATYHGSGGDKGTNLWMCIIGPSSMVYKSTVLKIGINLLWEANKSGDFSPRFLLPHRGSYESFIEIFTECPQGLIACDEFASLIQWFEKDYNGDLETLLTESFDYSLPVMERRVGTRQKAHWYSIVNPCANIMACSTLDWFNDKMTASRIRGGFLPRFILIPEQSPGTFIPTTPPPDDLKKTDLVTDIQFLKAHPEWGKMTYTTQALNAFEDWAKEFLSPLINSVPAPYPSFIQRRCTDLHKFSIIHAVMRDAGQMNLDDLIQSIDLIESVIRHGQDLVENKITTSKSHREINRVLEIIQKNAEAIPSPNGTKIHGMPRWKAMKYSHLTAKQFDEFRDTLLQEHEIEEVLVSTNGRPAVYYKVSTNGNTPGD